MKTKQSIAAVGIMFVLALLSCAQKSDEIAARNKAVVLQTLDVLNNRQYEKLDQFYAPDFKRHCQATPDARVESLDDFKALINEWDRQFPDGKYEVILTAAEGDLVAFFMTYSGTNEGQIGVFAPTGKTMTAECAGFHRLDQGKIVETWVTWDNLAVLSQLGLFPLAPQS